MQDSNSLMTEPIFWWMAIASAVVFAASLVAVPWVIVRLPADYFSHRHRVAHKPRDNAAVYYSIVLIKNLAGAAFITIGIGMLVLPGQGLLTILIGVSLIDFPGKYRFQQYLVSRRFISTPLNWVRRRAGKPGFEGIRVQR